MSSDPVLLRLRILETLGMPLLDAVEDAAARRGDQSPERETAAEIAALLSRAVQGSIALGESLRLRADDDAVRIALAALAARIVAAQYRAADGRLPAEADIKRSSAALEAVLSFADNFNPGAEGRARLEMADAAPDENQIALQYVAAMAPVVQEVAAFSFGRPETRLVQEIAERLTRDAEALRRDVAADAAGGAVRRAELVCLRLLAGAYAASHRQETERLGRLSPEDREKAAVNGQIPMEPLWDAYGTRMAMLAALGAVGGSDNAAGGSRAPAPAAAVSAAPPVAVPVAVAPVAPEEAPATDAPANPLSFFAKKNKQGGEEHG